MLSMVDKRFFMTKAFSAEATLRAVDTCRSVVFRDEN